MIPLRPARESEVVLAFLRAETDRWHYDARIQNLLHALGITNQQLIDADPRNEYYNVLREGVLDAFRGYLSRTGVFTKFPKEVAWQRVELGPGELAGRLRYVRSGEWMPRSDGTRQPQRVAEKFARDELDRKTAETVAGIRKRLELGEILPEIVAVEGEGTDLILLEGAHRTTAYVSLQWPKSVPAFIGSSPAMRDWLFY